MIYTNPRGIVGPKNTKFSVIEKINTNLITCLMSGECFLAISLILAYTPDCTSLIFSIGERAKYLVGVIL